MKLYDAGKIEKKWQRRWAAGHPKKKGGKRAYILDMFPYPSGDGLHTGHVENYTATDILARYKRLRGFDVLHPIGWDAFGLPAENFAIKTGVHPDVKTHQNIRNFTRQIKSLGLSYDWDREIDTSRPEYYKWTQWMFLFLYQNGLAYKKKASVNWCPSCKTVLANEQAEGGICERCKSTVVQKELEQWFFRITDFVEDARSKGGKKVAGLLSGLKKVDWPHSTKTAQENWIGRSEGVVVKFPFVIANRPMAVKQSRMDKDEIATGSQTHPRKDGFIEVFTTRLDTIFGCTYVVVAPEHGMIADCKLQIANWKEVERYLVRTRKKTELERTELAKEKTGVKLQGVSAVNPFTGETVPIFVADYVLGNYGTGAVMAVPAHDTRDFEFAKKYGLSARQSIAPFFAEATGPDAVRPEVPTVRRRTAFAIVKHWKEDKYLCLDWEKFGWHSGIIGGVEEGEDPPVAAAREIQEETGYRNVKLVRSLGGAMHTNFYAAHKGVNRYAEGTGMLFRIEDEEWEQPKEEDTKHHRSVWVAGDEMERFLNLKNFRYMWTVLKEEKDCFVEDGIVVNSGEFSGLSSAEARKNMTKWLEKNGLGKRKVNYRLRDWLISRQRYWGAPIPIIYCDACGTVPVPEKDLPVKLPKDVDFRPTGESPLTRSESFQKVRCPQCGKRARREADTMDTFVCSSWYYLRFADPQNARKFADPKKLAKYLPVDFYMGGAEHTVLHLLYARFFTKALAKYGYLGFDEPFLTLRHQGMVLAEDGRKMSKSLGNVVNPDEIVGELGADTLRLYEMFMGPLEDMKSWNTGSVIGLRRFLEKVWKVKSKVKSQKSKEEGNKELESLLHKTIKKVTEDIEGLKMNTAVSALMILVNALEREERISASRFKILLRLLAPFAPHIAEELWERSGEKKSIFLAEWPTWDRKKVIDETVTIAVQVNGKVRATIMVPAGSDEAEVKKMALDEKNVQEHIAEKEIRKVIYVPGKIFNIVV